MENIKKLIDKDAKQIVDILYDTKVFKNELTRDNLNLIEEYVSYLIETRITSYTKQKELISKL